MWSFASLSWVTGCLLASEVSAEVVTRVSADEVLTGETSP
jgi:hypothetical protein